MKKYISNFLKFLLFLSLGLGILYLLYRSQNKAYLAQCETDGIPLEQCSLIEKVINDFANANFFWLFMVIFFFMLSNVSRTIRWNMLIKPLSHKPRFINSFGSIMIGYFTNLGLPRAGEFVRAVTLSRYEKIELEKVVGTVATDRIIDVISILIVTFLALILAYDDIWEVLKAQANFGTIQKLLLLGSILGAFALIFFFIFRKRLEKTKLYQKVVNLLRGFAEGLSTIRKLERPWLFVFHSLSIWTLYYLLNYVCFFAFEPTSHLAPLVGLVVFTFGAWGIVIPTPGGMGSYHFLTGLALSIYGIAREDYFSYTMIAFITIQIGANVLFGLLSLLILPFANQNYQPVHESTKEN